MLYPIDPKAPPPPIAYRVPWRILRTDRTHPVVVNTGAEPVDFVRVFHDDADGRPRTDLWGQVLSGEEVRLCLCEADVDDVIVTLAWFRQDDGLEYVWRFVV